MKASIFSDNRLILIYSQGIYDRGVLSNFPPPSKIVQCENFEDLRSVSGDSWYNSLKVVICNNPYDVAVDTHFMFQSTIEPKSMTLTTSFKDKRWRELFNREIEHMKTPYHDAINLETFQDDMRRIQGMFNFQEDVTELRRAPFRPAGTEDYRTLYDGRTRAIITRVTKKIIQEHEYKF